MESQVTLELINDEIHVISPYSAHSNKQYKNVGGRFDFSTKKWVLPDTKPARTLIEQWFGLSDVLVEVEVEFYEYGEIGDSLYIDDSGYKLVTRKYRDASVIFHETVQLVSGVIPRSGGSVNNPRVGLGQNSTCVFKIVVREDFAIANELNIIKRVSLGDEKLKQEREKLLKRIEEIDNLLNANPSSVSVESEAAA